MLRLTLERSGAAGTSDEPGSEIRPDFRRFQRVGVWKQGLAPYP